MAHDQEIPVWLQVLEPEDFAFLKRFALASGSLKAVAQDYGISYPTVRNRLDRLIAKIQAADKTESNDPFRRKLQALIADGVLTTPRARDLLQAHEEVMEQEREAAQSSWLDSVEIRE